MHDRTGKKLTSTCTHRDVTEHLQLLLRKSGYHLHTSAEKEVVRMISASLAFPLRAREGRI